MATVRSENKRIGIFGGTFNPVHFGHLRAAEEVRQTLVLDLMVLMPSARPPHKNQTDLAAAEQRLEMVRRARRGNPFLACSAFECRKPGTSYSVETLAYFRQCFPGAELFFVLGWDAWAEIEGWYDFPRFFGLADFVVISRQGCEPWRESRVQSLFPFALQAEFCYESENCYRHLSGHRLFFMSVTRLDISSSQVRREAVAGRSLRYLVPEGVAEYISRSGIYI